MNPQQDQTPGLPMPQPSFDMASVPAGMPAQYQQPNQIAPQPQMPGQAAYDAQSMMPPIQTAIAGVEQQPSQPPQNPQPPAVPMATVPDVAAAAGPEDETALDQEWVARAREIVTRTHADPYLQSQELGKIKAQYIKVRYNKDIKTGDE